jgi:SNF2 family DNA or RNA helicase
MAVNIEFAYGRLYVSGPEHRRLERLPGAALDYRRGRVQMAATADSFRAIRTQLGITRQELARYCSPRALAYGRWLAADQQQVQQVHAFIDSGNRMAAPWTDTHGVRRAPFEHQTVWYTAAMMLDGIAMLGDVGTAKTRAALETIRTLIPVVPRWIVACPTSVVRTWKNQNAEWTGDRLHVIPLEGPVRERIAALHAFTNPGTVFVVNYETLAKLEEAILSLGDFGFVCDESQKLKNPNAGRTKAAMRIAVAAKRRFCLTGTSILQGPQDAWAQWFIVDHGRTFGPNYVQFRRDWFHEDQFGRLTPRAGALERIGQKMQWRAWRFSKDECFDLPPQIFETREVEMTRAQAQAYQEMAEELVATLPESVTPATAATQLTSMLRLAQITSGAIPDANGIMRRFLPNPKMDLLEELVRDEIEAQQIIVWAHFQEDIRMAGERLADLHPVFIWGEQTGARGRNEREEAERAFQAGERRLLIANPGAGGVGLNLQASSLAVYYSRSFALEAWLQSIGRNHRAGSERHDRITYISLLVPGTIDEIIAAALDRKESTLNIVQNVRRHLLREAA